MRNCILLIALIGLAGCINNRSKKHHKFTVNLCQYEPNKCACNLYVEVYTVYQMGALGSDVDSEYLTDTVNFRVYVGTYDEEDEMITTKCKGDSVYITKTKQTSADHQWDIPKILETKSYGLKDLKKRSVFE